MKTLKILALLCIIIFYTTNNVNSQPVRTEYKVTIGFFVPCVNEVLRGTIIAERTIWTNVKEDSPNPYSKIQLKYDNTIVYGLTSHLKYMLEFISNGEWAGEGANVNHFVRMVLVRLDGKLIAMLPMLVQKTVTPEGEIVVNINDLDVRCF
jgi:hypothetical protein